MRNVLKFVKSCFTAAETNTLESAQPKVTANVGLTTPCSSSSRRRKRTLESMSANQGNSVKKSCLQIARLSNALALDEDGKKEASIDLLCLAHRVFAHYHSGADATQGNVLFELQTMRVLNRYYDENNQLHYCGNARNQPDAKQGNIMHEFKSRKVDSWDENGFSLRLATLMATWQFPDTENIMMKMSDPNRRVSYALRCPGETEPVFLLHIHSVAGRQAEIEMYRQLTSNFVTRKHQHSRNCKVPTSPFSSTTYTVNLGRLLSSVGEKDYCIFVHGQQVDISHQEFLRLVSSKHGYQIARQTM